MIELRKAILTKLEDYHDQDKVYYERALKKEKFPYVIYSFPNSFMNEEQEIFVMDVDIWDNDSDTTEIEIIASDIWRGLNRYRYIDKNIQFSIYRSHRLPPLDEEDKNIKRRKLIFELRYFDRRL